MTGTPPADVVVIGAGVGGLSAALAASEGLASSGGRVVLLEKAPQPQSGGNTKWTDAYFRLEDVYEPAAGFVEDMLEFSQGKTDRAYVEKLVAELPYAMDWVQSHGVRFHRRPTYFVTASRPRMMPVGGGESLVRHLTAACDKAGVEINYGAAVTGLERAGTDVLVSVEQDHTLRTRACIAACGGFEGDPARLAQHLGEPARQIKPIAPGGAFNTGEVIDMLLRLGAAPAGEWSNFHGEPVDARSTQPEASVMVFTYGILLDNAGKRFIDEGRGTVDETYEDLARAILVRPGCRAAFVADATLLEVPGIERGLLTDRAPFRADSLEELAELLELDGPTFVATVAEYNAAPRHGAYDPSRPDGLHTDDISPPKSNWATRIEKPPFLGIPLTTDIVFTYGGVATDDRARAVDADGQALPGLYAAGECTGIYHHKYPGATSVMRGLVYGRVAGREAADFVAGRQAGAFVGLSHD
jgi:tricarballylate dehydrogenase